MTTEQPEWMNLDAITAVADLVGRAGGAGFEIGYLNDDVPMEKAGWYAQASYLGARLVASDHASPTAAATALAERILRNATCKCRRTVTFRDDQAATHCRWRLMGARWEPGCDAPPIAVDCKRGDVEAMRRALDA